MLVELKKQHPGEDARVTTCFQTLLKMVGNVARAPGEAKFRSVRLSNPVILEKVLSLDGSIQFLEAVGFQVCVCRWWCQSVWVVSKCMGGVTSATCIF